MSVGRAVTSIVVRGVIFGFVIAALAPAARPRMQPSAHLASFSRAGLGFFASVTVAVMLMLALSTAVSPPAPQFAALGLRGSI